MAYIRVTSPTWADFNPLRPGDIVEVDDETAARWKRIGVGRDSNKAAYEGFVAIRQEEAESQAREQGQAASTGQSEEDLETERRALALEERQRNTPVMTRQNVPGGRDAVASGQLPEAKK